MTDESILFMPKCCVDTKLPTAVIQAPQRELTFYTEGNITMEALFRAVSHLVEPPCVMVLTMPTLDEETFAFLNQCFFRGWIVDLVLTTLNDYSKLVNKRLGEYAKHVLYRIDDKVSSYCSHMVLYSQRNSMSICGPMLARALMRTIMCYNLHLHSGYGSFSDKDYGHSILNVVRPDIMRFRGKWLQKNEDIVKSKSKNLQNFIYGNLPKFKA